MRWRALVFTAVVSAVLLATASPALAKGPDQATIDGPGLAHPIVVAGYGEPGSGDNLGQLSEGSGLFLAMFGADGSGTQALASAAPAGPLGPKYELSYRIPDGSTTGATLRQDLYPSASGGPVTYTKAGQVVFGTESRGGWYRAPEPFGKLLTRLGVPDGVVASSAPSSGPAAGAAAVGQPVSPPTDGMPWLLIGAGGLVVCAGVISITVMRARRRPVTQP